MLVAIRQGRLAVKRAQNARKSTRTRENRKENGQNALYHISMNIWAITTLVAVLRA